jgi:hypothetical protein
MDGFEAYHALDCGGGELVSISLLRDEEAAEDSDERALEFVRGELGDFDIERTEVIGGEVTVSRAMATLLEPAHACSKWDGRRIPRAAVPAPVWNTPTRLSGAVSAKSPATARRPTG